MEEHTRQTNRTNEANVDNALVAKTSCSEIDIDLAGHDKVSPGCLIGEEGKHEVLKESARVLQMHIYTACRVRGLLEENGVSCYFADVDGYFLWGSVSHVK